jgi:hypothetical protein
MTMNIVRRSRDGMNSYIDFKFHLPNKKYSQACWLHFNTFNEQINKMYKNKDALGGLEFSLHLLMEEEAFDGHVF